ncbi:hypothetical protein IDH44_13905 [Paenibacillus sp. IB182496]|uniref:Uncharacterized protein n=1 Tax=Paenibacillus sabuli TaxID=2772509 RepID=A0A927BVU7_9BACL|nr:hypothetical protein [Paenibacillus sabuli]MBD2846293.1 hypothetical protein [Paenibacillus sabuli]
MHLTKDDFRRLIEEELNDSEDEEAPFESIAMLDDRTIEAVLDTSGEGGEIGAAFMTLFMDAILRNFYMASDFYEDGQQPLIRFLDTEGKVLAENEDFVQSGS